MGLNQEIKLRRAEIFSDGYPVSIGELINMYEDRELNIRPQFQRYFRWTDVQQSRLIESLLLGIPIPSIFVSQRKDGVWDVIDGLQRLSTIFQFVGIIRGANGKRSDLLLLTKTKYLPSLEGKTWDGEKTDGIGRDNQLLIKRSKIDVKIILRESSEESKYELFQRLNSGGSQLSDQEMRNVIAITVAPQFYEWLAGLATNDDFMSCIALSEKALAEQYHLELVTRFIVLSRIQHDDFRKIGDLGDFLTDETVRFAGDRSFNRSKEKRIFEATFRILSKLGTDAFRRFDPGKDRHQGGFLISAFEVFAIGLSWHVGRGKRDVDEESLKRIAKEIWLDNTFTDSIGSGVRASSRIPVVIPYARERLRECLSVARAN